MVPLPLLIPQFHCAYTLTELATTLLLASSDAGMGPTHEVEVCVRLLSPTEMNMRGVPVAGQAVPSEEVRPDHRYANAKV